MQFFMNYCCVCWGYLCFCVPLRGHNKNYCHIWGWIDWVFSGWGIFLGMPLVLDFSIHSLSYFLQNALVLDKGCALLFPFSWEPRLGGLERSLLGRDSVLWSIGEISVGVGLLLLRIWWGSWFSCWQVEVSVKGVSQVVSGWCTR